MSGPKGGAVDEVSTTNLCTRSVATATEEIATDP